MGRNVPLPQVIEPEAVNKWLFNKDTVDKVLAHVMDCRSEKWPEATVGQNHHLRQEPGSREVHRGAVRRELSTVTKARLRE